VMRHGGGIVALYNEPLVLRSLMQEGYSIGEARHFANDGCWEIQIPGKTNFSYSPFDGLQILNRVLGTDREGGTPDFPTAEALYQAYLAALAQDIDAIYQKRVADTYELRGGRWRSIEPVKPSSVISLFEDGCLQKGQFYDDLGPEYTLRSPHIGGAPDVANSLYAIDQLVFREKKLTLAQLIRLVRQNWEGAEPLRQYVRTKYTYYAAALKRTDGSGLYGKLDGGYALDPTHPATVQRFTDKLNYFIDLGFEYVKLDFMAHGAAEGQHYDQNITTGIQAYNYGMAKILEICQGKMYVNLSIAPLFPYQYADGRRISCDAFASLDNTRHVLSYLTACFWEGGIYPYPDPDHLVVWGSDGNVTDGEARCRVTAGAISGTSFLVGDDLTDIEPGSDKAERILAMFGNRDIIAAAKLGRMFTPWEVIPGEKCAQSYWCTAGDAFYLAVFNFDSDAMDYSFHLANHLAEHDEFTAKELWRGTEFSLTGKTLVVTVPKKDAALYRITPVHPETVPADDVQMVITDSSNKVVKEKNGMLPFIIGGAAVVLAAAAAVMVKNNKKK